MVGAWSVAMLVFLVVFCETLAMPPQMDERIERESKAITTFAKDLKSDNIPYIMYWRPQKVGSSTILSILLSFGFRNNIVPRRKSNVQNQICAMIASCAFHKYNSTSIEYAKSYDIDQDKLLSAMKKSGDKRKGKKFDIKDTVIPYQTKLSVSHNMCNLPAYIISNEIHCIHASNLPSILGKTKPKDYNIKEIFSVRDPLSRMLSIYYFWGELFKLKKPRDDRKRKSFIGSTNSTSPVQGNLFYYHGDELTPPPEDIAIQYAKRLPLNEEMPGPSYTWSAFSNNAKSTVNIVKTDRVMTIVLERMDESLVALAHYLNWSLGDIVITVPRKSLSKHPKAEDWPRSAINLLKESLKSKGEYDVYNAVDAKLTERVSALNKNGYNIAEEIKLLQLIKEKVSGICLDLSYLERYKTIISNKELMNQPYNRLRDVDKSFYDANHVFFFNRELLYSFDVCSGCESHAILYTLKNENGYLKTNDNANNYKDAITKAVNFAALYQQNPTIADDRAQLKNCIL